MENIIITSTLATILGCTSLNTSATGIANGDTLTIDSGGSQITGCLLGTPLPCNTSALNITAQTGSFFTVGGAAANISNNSDILLGSSEFIIFPEETGAHRVTGPVSVISPTELNFTGLDIIWDSILSAISVGGCQTGNPANNDGFSGCDPDQDGIDDTINTGIALITATDNTYILDYFANIPAGDPSNFGGGALTLHLEGKIIHAVPVPAAVWLFGSGIVGLSGIARRRSKI